MKLGKLFIFAILMCSLLMASNTTVLAVDESDTVNDGLNDVYTFDFLDVYSENFEMGIVDPDDYDRIDVENLDIAKAEYERTGNTVTLSLEVNEDGIIEDRGSFDDLFFSSAGLIYDTVGYQFLLLTSEYEYSISYANDTCKLLYSSSTEYGDFVNISESNYSVDDNKLEVTIELFSDDETYEELQATTSYIYIDLTDVDPELSDPEALESFIFLKDDAPNQPLTIDAYTQNLGFIDTEISFNSSVFYGLPPYTYEWKFGDGQTSTKANPTHTYTKKGTYEWNLSVTDSDGNTQYAEGEIEIKVETSTEETAPILLFIGIIVVIAIVGAIAVVIIIRR